MVLAEPDRAEPSRSARRTVNVTLSHRQGGLPGKVGRPVVHQPPPQLEQVRTRVGRLDLVLDHVGQRRLDDLAGGAVSSAAQSRNDERNPAERPRPSWFFSSRESAMSCNRLPPMLGKTSTPPPPSSVRAAPRMSRDHTWVRRVHLVPSWPTDLARPRCGPSRSPPLAGVPKTR